MKRSISFVTVTLLTIGIAPWVSAAPIEFRAQAPVPDSDDIVNLVGASRDGLNVNDDNGLDGPLNDQFTYVAPDRPRQGQTFRTPGNFAASFRVSAIWVRLVGYTENGTMPEQGFNGTETDFSGGRLFLRILDLELPGLAIRKAEVWDLTGTEPSNPNGAGRSSTTNGLGTWLRLPMDPGPVTLGGDRLHSFDLVSTATARFELWGSNTDTYPAGNAYNGNQLGMNSIIGETDRNPLIGDRAFMIEGQLIPEPSPCALAILGSWMIVGGWRRLS